jgi:single-stranded-DNA-specific exonuclease
MLRNITLDALEKLLQSRFKEGFLSLKDLPSPNRFKDMEKATKRIVAAITANEKITIIGDYDVDGVTATTILKCFFDEIGYGVKWIIPNRFTDGYGISVEIISRMEDTDLVITVDNGIAAVQAAQLCKEKGIELIITDHHLPGPAIPEAYAIIDQKQAACCFPYEEVCGAQIAWYLVASLKNALGLKIPMMPYMALAAVAIIADVMPLRHINRAMVVAGMASLSKGEKPAIKAFMAHMEKEVLMAEDIAFGLAPLLNAAGRMEDASLAVEFLMSTNIYDARVRLERLLALNKRRKETEAEITCEALRQADKNHAVVIVDGKGWHEGVIGIVAARVARIFEKPCIVLSEDEKGILKGSGRSYGEYDLFRLIDSCREHLDKFGGHKAAIGLSLSKSTLNAFKADVEHKFYTLPVPETCMDTEIVGDLSFSEISFNLTEMMKKYEPYGEGNPRPKFMTENVEIVEVESMGKEGEHRRFSFRHGDVMMPGVQFKTTASYRQGERVTLFYTLNENHFRGNVSLQLNVEKIVVE